MAKQMVYLLLLNEQVIFPSFNVKTLWFTLSNRCKQDHMELPEPYHTARRRLKKDGKYVHASNPGYKYQIIERQLLRKPVQHRINLFDTPTI